jgi:hypothetical protein
LYKAQTTHPALLNQRDSNQYRLMPPETSKSVAFSLFDMASALSTTGSQLEIQQLLLIAVKNFEAVMGSITRKQSDEIYLKNHR